MDVPRRQEVRQSAGALPAREAGGAGLRLDHPVRPLWGEAPGPGATVAVSLALGGGVPVPRMAGAGAGFLVDALHGVVAPAELARMVGCLAVFLAGAAGGGSAEVTLATGRGVAGAARLDRPVFEVERNGFGAAHILHERAAVGLYVLEIAPGSAIPPHFHRVMQEAELVLDAGLLLQGRPVAPGEAFVWPAGRVHAYANPGVEPRRVLCIDRPKFMPEDEVEVAGPVDLAPAQPSRSYPV